MRKASYKLMASLARAAGRLSNVSATKGIRRVNKIWTAASARLRKIRIRIQKFLEALPREDTKEAVR